MIFTTKYSLSVSQNFKTDSQEKCTCMYVTQKKNYFHFKSATKILQNVTISGGNFKNIFFYKNETHTISMGLKLKHNKTASHNVPTTNTMKPLLIQ
jgi:hypothetical protein